MTRVDDVSDDNSQNNKHIPYYKMPALLVTRQLLPNS